MILKQLSFSNKLGDNIVTVTNNVLTHIFEDFSSCEFLPLLHNHWRYRYTYGKLSHNEGDISTRFLPLSVNFFLYINMGMCFCLLYLIKIFKMAAEVYRGEFRYNSTRKDAGCHHYFHLANAGRTSSSLQQMNQRERDVHSQTKN